MLLSVIIAAFSLSQAHHTGPAPGPVSASEDVVYAWSHCYIAAFSLSQAHNAIPGPGSVPDAGAVVHAWSHCYIAAFSLSQSHNAILGPRSVPVQELWLTVRDTATLLLYPFLRHMTLFLVNLSQCRSCG